MSYIEFIKMDMSHYGGDISHRLSLDVASYTDANNNGEKLTGSKRGDKYSLRPRSTRRGQEDDPKPSPIITKSRVTKPKQKPAPLSKYRRKTANARERTRMREINTAFEALRRAVPHLQCAGPVPPSANEKLTKITTLRLAMKYISALSATLKDSSGSTSAHPSCTSSDFGDLFSDCSDLDCLFLESDGESMHLQSDLSEHSLTPDTTSDHCLTPVNLSADFPNHFVDHSLSPTFPDQSLSPFDSLFPDFS